VGGTSSITGTASLDDHRRRWVEDQAVETRLASMHEDGGGGSGADVLAYRAEVARTRQILTLLLPCDAVCLVVSHGDPELVQLGRVPAWHFPCDVDRGSYAGYHPVDSTAAIDHLDFLGRRGATHLAIPRSARWWLQAYPDFAAYLRRCARLILDDEASTMLYDLRAGPRPEPEAADARDC
jgi:hypothetical protein